jgi:transcriptional regulator with XRE-family HTH domain
MQAVFSSLLYAADMANAASRLRQLREKAGLSLRELARQINEQPSNVNYWETSGNLPRSDVLVSIAKTLGVTVEELLGEPRPKRAVPPGGKLGRIIQTVSRLPRRQQDKVVDMFETVLAGQQSKTNGHSKAA